VNNDTRPVNLDLTKFSFPISALASITHRIAGMALFAGMAILLAVLDLSLVSAEGFDTVKGIMAQPLVKLVTWGLVSALIYHLIAGIKHLCLDLEIGESLEGSRLAAYLVIASSVICIALTGLWIF
jgi:succinate dehydrogenase / fumarate reductase cytochrome b subunit